MSLLSLEQISVAFGQNPLLSKLSFQRTPGERVAINRRNGAGKSTLLKVISGEQVADEGMVRHRRGVKVATSFHKSLPAAQWTKRFVKSVSEARPSPYFDGTVIF